MPSIDAIEGMGTRAARQLRKSGVRTTDGLLRRAFVKKGRVDLAGKTGLAESQLAAWVNSADLMRIRGIGSEYAHLLSTAGVDTVKELRRRNARSLTVALTELNDQKRSVRRLPTEAMVAAWIETAKELGAPPTL